jgi:glycosyltransferase involved in cell wall biosynthesis
VAYFVHNLADPAVARRITMMRAGGAEVTVAGFCREERAPVEVAGAAAISLGRTHDAALRQRAQMVLRHLARPAAILDAARGADVIVARNLEMLALAHRVRRREGIGRLVYESLDIHRSLLGGGPASKALRGIERRLMRGADLLIHSSPAFLNHYFTPTQQLAIPTRLIENKLLRLSGETPGAGGLEAGPPWSIGWFGNLRCRRTLAILLALAEAAEGRIEVLIAGKASPAEFPDFAAQAAHPHVRYVGPYTAADLPELYRQCHFAWAIDYFEDGLNSTWLLPNRLYEAAAFGTVPIALASVETGRWLARHCAGLLLPDGDPVPMMLDRLGALGAADYADLRRAVAVIPHSDLVADRDDCEALVAALTG